MFAAWTQGEFQACRHLDFVAVVGPDGWSVWKGRTRVGRGPETGAAGRAAALGAMR